MTIALSQLADCTPPGDWPQWVITAPYDDRCHPQATPLPALEEGANCQRFAYAVLRLFGLAVPPHRSSELWNDPNLIHLPASEARDQDLVLFNRSSDAWGAHVAVVISGHLLHLCEEIGFPAVWEWSDFAARDRYRCVVGAVRIA